jgi:hypothetical protein
MRLEVRIPVLLTAAVAIAGCAVLRSVTLGSSDHARGEFFPLHPGTLWVYEVRDAQGRIALERVLVRGAYHLKAHETDATIVEESGGMTGELDLDVSWHPVAYYRRGPFLYKFSGVNYVGGELHEQSLGEGEEKVLPADPAENRRWESDFEIFRNEGTGYGARMVSEIQPSLESVRVRAGTFRKCLRVDSESVLATRSPHSEGATVVFHYTDWYAAGVGLVKSEVHTSEREQPRPVTTFELVSFRDGKGPD